MTYRIAIAPSGHLIATASNDKLLRERAELEIAEAGLSLTFGDMTVEDNLTLYKSEADIPPSADVVYSGTEMGWLEDDAGQMIYVAAAR